MANKNLSPYQKEQAWQTEKARAYQTGAYVDTNNKGYYTNAEKDALAKSNNHETEAEREQQRVYTQGFKNTNDPFKPKNVPQFTYNPVGGFGGSGGVGGSGAINRQANFQASEAYNQAMNYTNQLLSQLNTGKTSYTDQINSLMDSINNRASFAYDPDTDPLFQQYLASSMESGKTAMQDTMAQASALTGGYGSSYATAAANGAYNNFVQDAYNNLPEYYQTALDAYNSETNNLYNRLNMYNVADATEYGRLADAYQNNLNMANDMYGKEYSNYWDALNYDTSIDQYNADQAYRYASLAQDNAQFNAKMAYQAQQDQIAQQNYENELLYKAQQDAIAQNAEPTYTAPTTTQYNNAIKAYEQAEGGGFDGLKKYIASLPEDIDVEAIMDYVLEYGNRGANVTDEQNMEKYRIKARVANGK